MSHDASKMGLSFQKPLDGHRDARALIRLIQCSQCSRPFRNPVTLPCGNSLCRSCLPPSHVRENVSYPEFTSRRIAITCPFSGDCSHKIHSLDDCSANVVLNNVMGTISEKVEQYKTLAGDRKTSIEELVTWNDPAPDSMSLEETHEAEKGHTRTLSGGPLIATYLFAELGELHYDSEAKYEDATADVDASSEDEIATQDNEVLNALRDTCHKELDCQVCYNLMLDPVTTPCGHTFCRKCLARTLDHARLCAICRRVLPLTANLVNQLNNKTLVNLLTSLCPEQVHARAEAVDLDERSAPGGLDTAIFVVSVCLPGMPQVLHVFEPRYRLMIRRAIQGNGQFGMVGHNVLGQAQGTLGRTQFVQYGVMVSIEHYEFLHDGRIVLMCRGVSRFKIVAHGILDGYTMARVEKVDDVGLMEEERLESEELSQPTVTMDAPAHIDQFSTRQLMDIGSEFLQRAREASPSWFPPNVIEIYGTPPTDPAIFPYWFAAVVPLHEVEKYKLLSVTSVRERLKMTVRWVHKIDQQRW